MYDQSKVNNEDYMDRVNAFFCLKIVLQKQDNETELETYEEEMNVFINNYIETTAESTLTD